MQNSNFIFQIRLTISLLFVSLSYAGITQVGLRKKYNIQQVKNWQDALHERFATTESLYPQSYELGVDYWFRLKKRRVEFMPEIAYTASTTTYNNAVLDQFNLQMFSFNFNTQLYALDMGEDCDCPTFSKQGPAINKGLFFHVTPGISYFNASGTTVPISSFALAPSESNGVIFKIGGGIGLDLGVSDFLTITPIASYYFHTPMTWDQLRSVNGELQESKNILKQFQFTIRLGFRRDYTNKRRFRR